MSGPPVPDIVGVIIHTSKAAFPEMRRFYCEILGLEPHSDREGFVNFEWGGMRLTINLHDRVSGRSTDPNRLLINFAVDDLTTWHARFSEEGIPSFRAPTPEPWGGLVATYADPDGNLIQLIQF